MSRVRGRDFAQQQCGLLLLLFGPKSRARSQAKKREHEGRLEQYAIQADFEGAKSALRICAAPRPNERLEAKLELDCDLGSQFRGSTEAGYLAKSRKPGRKLCDPWSHTLALPRLAPFLALTLLLLETATTIATATAAASHSNLKQNSTSTSSSSPSIIIDQQSFSGAQLLPTSTTTSTANNNQPFHQQQPANHIGAHLQPSYVYGARNRSINFTHVAIDELTGSIYVGATNWLLQLSASNLKAEFALKTGPAVENSRDCAPADCLAQIAHIEASSLPAHHAHGSDLSVPASGPNRRPPAGTTMHTAGSNSSYALLAAPRSGGGPGIRLAGGPLPTATQHALTSGQSATLTGQATATSPTSASQLQNNNYNKILAIDHEAKQLIVCGSLNQGACRKHQLGQLANFSDLIPLPVASNDEHSSSVALISSPGRQQRPIMYVAATNSRLGPYREMVPAISARYLDPPSKSMQIIEKSFTDSARVDISFELRDYYLVNYVYAFQHNDFVYFATVQRKSPLRQLEEWGYTSRLARLCLSDLSFQSYTELTLECQSASNSKRQTRQQAQGSTNYNLLQDAHLTSASSHLAQQLGIRAQSAVLAAVFSQSKDHTTRSQQKSAICLFPLDKIERKFNENIHMCYNGSAKARNMNYIAGSVNDCPKAGMAGNVANFCSEPLKLNGSLPLTSSPILTYDNELLTSIVATQAPTSPLSQQVQLLNHETSQQIRRPTVQGSSRQHQVLLVGTSSGALKRIALQSGDQGFGLRGVEFDSVQVDEQQEPILADLNLIPANNPQLAELAPLSAAIAQFAIVATPNKIAKLRINSCRAPKGSRANNSSAMDECSLCAQLQDPFCGWCASTSSCSTRDECLLSTTQSVSSLHWSPFDQIRCADYQPVVPQFVPIQTTSHQTIEVNVRVPHVQSAKQRTQASANLQQLAHQLAQAQFTCHFDYLALANRSAPMPQLSGATTKATQARLNLHTSTVVIGCPLPPPGQRAQLNEQRGGDQLRAKLSVRLASAQQFGHTNSDLTIQHLLGLRASRGSESLTGGGGGGGGGSGAATSGVDEIEREITLYDCSHHSSCRSCLSAGAATGATGRRWSCAWCPLSSKCTFNASHADLGCVASAISTTPHSAPSPNSNSLRAAHLMQSLDLAQTSVFGVSIERIGQCPATNAELDDSFELPTQPTQSSSSLSAPTIESRPAKVEQARAKGQANGEILIPNNSRRSIQVNLRQPLGSNFANNNAKRKLECLLEIEGAKARLNGRLLEGNQLVVCQESTFSYQEEIATQRAQLLVIYNDNQVIEMTDVILYKCHLFGVSPPALVSSIGAGIGGQAAGPVLQQHSSAAWRANELLLQALAPETSASSLFRRQTGFGLSDCSLCSNVERKYQCVWCQNQCQHAHQCSAELTASTCPPPRIDSIHPTSGPLEGGTLLTIEGSNLGSNEREIQDKISVGGEPCQLVMYSVSTRIVCKTGQSSHGPQAATVFVGNRAGVTSAHEKFHYKAVHLTDVNPRVGPISGGTRLYLTGSNLNIGSRIQVFLDDIPCSLDNNHELVSSGQITCITAPNLLATSTRITKLTLMIDNSTHYLPYPFTYLPDPIITSIEPAESFVSGGRLILIAGHHLASPQSTKLMIYHEQKHNVINGTSCITQNDTLITCLTPALSRDLLANLLAGTSAGIQESESQQQPISLSYESGGLKLKMSLFMDDVRSVRNLDEYYHHLPHYMTYYEDPQLFRLSSPVVEFSSELVIPGENLMMKQLDQDMLITIGAHICVIKSILANQVVCEPPQKVAPIYDETGRLKDRPLLSIVALVGSNLKYQIGHMQYSSRQYQLIAPDSSHLNSATYPNLSSSSADLSSTINNPTNSSATMLVVLSCIGILLGFAATLIFALSRYRRTIAEREYKRIQLQMGSLDINGQPIGGDLFDNIHHMNTSQSGPPSSRAHALDFVGGKKLTYQLNQQLTSFPPSPITDVSSLTGSNLQAHNQHVVKLSSNGTIINSLAHHYNSTTNSSSSQSSPSSTRNSNNAFLQAPNDFIRHKQPQHQAQGYSNTSDKSNLLAANTNLVRGNSRNFSWTQEAPSTIVPYAVIEACDLTLEGKNAIKEYV